LSDAANPFTWISPRPSLILTGDTLVTLPQTLMGFGGNGVLLKSDIRTA
jgi:hypothetical protein